MKRAEKACLEVDGGARVGHRGVCEQWKENVVAEKREVGSGLLGGRVDVGQNDKRVDDSPVRGNETIQLVVAGEVELGVSECRYAYRAISANERVATSV